LSVCLFVCLSVFILAIFHFDSFASLSYSLIGYQFDMKSPSLLGFGFKLTKKSTPTPELDIDQSQVSRLDILSPASIDLNLFKTPPARVKIEILNEVTKEAPLSITLR
jgi:hypothetical protein